MQSQWNFVSIELIQIAGSVLLDIDNLLPFRFLYLNITLIHTFIVREHVKTGLSAAVFYNMTVLRDGTVAVTGMENNQYKLKLFNMEAGLEISSTDVAEARGIAEVKLGGKSTLALTFQ